MAVLLKDLLERKILLLEQERKISVISVAIEGKEVKGC